MKSAWLRFAIVGCLLVSVAGCASGPLTTREKAGMIGTGLGAASGAVIGSTVGHAAADALIGDQLIGQQQRHDDQARTIDQNRQELERLRRENIRLRHQQREW